MFVDNVLAAKERFEVDMAEEKLNLSIGVMMGSDGKPLKSAAYYATYAKLAGKLLGDSERGMYLTPDPEVIKAAREFLLDELCIPSDVRSLCAISWCEGGGSGALARAIQLSLLFYDYCIGATLLIQEKGWPGYTCFAKANRLKLKEVPVDLAAGAPPALLIAQTVHNGTSMRISRLHWDALAKIRARDLAPTILDIPYAGFDFADFGFPWALYFSSTAPIDAFLRYRAPLIIAWSPTKTKGTFKARPGGAVIAVCSNTDAREETEMALAELARGSTGFMSMTTYALLVAMRDDPEGLRQDHKEALARVAEAHRVWKGCAAQSPLAPYFESALYYGMYRVLPARQGAVERLAENHVHVMKQSENEIRVNLTGLPNLRAEKWVNLIIEELAL